MATTYPWQTSSGDGDALDSRGGRHVKFHMGDMVQVGSRCGTVTDVGTVLIEFQTSDGCLPVACPREMVKISSLPPGVSLHLLSQQQRGVGS
jgi:hypothetical protein